MPNLSEERFNRFAQHYVTSQTHAKGHDLERLLAIAAPQPDWQVLDIATGGGHTALLFAPHVKSVIASDIAAKMLDAAKTHITEKGAANVTFQLSPADALPFEDQTFDMVTCRIAPHHFPDAAKFVQEAARTLKPGGLFLVQDQVVPEDAATGDYINAFEKLRDPSHKEAYSEATWRAMFTAAGLTVEHTEQLTKRHNLLHWAKMQDCAPQTIQQLEAMLSDAPLQAATWLESENPGTADASFINHHLIIAGRKPA